MLSFLSLPPELMLEITDNFKLHDISALLQTNRRLSHLLKSTLLTGLIRSRSLTHGRRLLYQLASQQDLIEVEYVIEQGILDFTDQVTLLHEAVRSQSVHVLETLLHFGLSPDTKDAKSRTPLGIAAKHGRVDFVRALAAREDVDVNWKDCKSMTPLLLAVRAGQEDVVRILVQSANADLQHFSDTAKGNCLHAAAVHGDVPMLRFLLDFMDPSEENNTSQTALHLAAVTGNFPAVECLLEDQRVDPNAVDFGGETVFHIAVRWEQLGIVKILLSDPGVEMNKVDFRGRTPLHVAVYRGSVDVIRLLLSSPEVDVSLPDETPLGNTPLHTAICDGNLEILQLLMDHARVDVNLRNLLGISPLILAVELGCFSVVRLLMQHPQLNLVLKPIDGERALDSRDLTLTVGRERLRVLIEEVKNDNW